MSSSESDVEPSSAGRPAEQPELPRGVLSAHGPAALPQPSGADNLWSVRVGAAPHAVRDRVVERAVNAQPYADSQALRPTVGVHRVLQESAVLALEAEH